MPCTLRLPHTYLATPLTAASASRSFEDDVSPCVEMSAVFGRIREHYAQVGRSSPLPRSNLARRSTAQPSLAVCSRSLPWQCGRKGQAACVSFDFSIDPRSVQAFSQLVDGVVGSTLP